MIYEWYSGSDKTLEVPKRIAKWLDDENASRPDILRDIEWALSIEEDPNWRAKLTYWAAREQQQSENLGEAIRLFQEARSLFDPVAANFRDVAEEYCRTLYHLINEHFLPSDLEEEVISASIVIMAHARSSEVTFDPEEWDILSGAFGTALNVFAREHDHKALHHAALGVYQAAHHESPEEPGILESLLYSYFYVGDIDACREMYRMYLDVSQNDPHRSDVIEFFQERVGPV